MYWHNPLGDYLEDVIEPEDKPLNAAYDDGYGFGRAFGSLFVVRATEMSKIIAVAQKFGKWEGYRDLEAGMEYIRGFADGIYASQPKQIEETKKSAKE